MNVETQERQEISFQELPIGSKFRGPDGGMYWKMNDRQVLPIRESPFDEARPLAAASEKGALSERSESKGTDRSGSRKRGDSAPASLWPDGGEIGWGTTFEWKPEWDATMKFASLSDDEVQQFRKANTVDLHEGQPIRVFIEDVCDTLREASGALGARLRRLFQRS